MPYDHKQINTVEADATLLGLQTTIFMGIKKLIVEGDSKIVITMKESLEE